MPAWEESSTARVVPPALPRKLAKVPFVQLADGRLQGVVSSGSDIGRVYVSAIAAGGFEFACSTNNNRPCGGAHGGYCKHLTALIAEGVVQFGGARVARYLRVDTEAAEPDAGDIGRVMTAARPAKAESSPAAAVFARFLNHLEYLEFEATTEPLPDMQWFPTAGAVA
ncbi:hypothetical protein [Kitasatospora sp. SUK 42]|uniref:hypothetical protein n=1 Tax=Kitasatospora sp. SUK 42 TaxID=1588882 RepID=UPI0018CB2890|nr:hypothetical protein [Kitasatospora sp. SUK 42]MBV2155315.1 hypothetical protein [Kitasatospora sp. SUK 42]